MKKLIRNMDTPESRAFWEGVERSAKLARNSPNWARAGADIAQTPTLPKLKRGIHLDNERFITTDEISLLIKEHARFVQVLHDIIDIEAKIPKDNSERSKAFSQASDIVELAFRLSQSEQ